MHHNLFWYIEPVTTTTDEFDTFCTNNSEKYKEYSVFKCHCSLCTRMK